MAFCLRLLGLSLPRDRLRSFDKLRSFVCSLVSRCASLAPAYAKSLALLTTLHKQERRAARFGVFFVGGGWRGAVGLLWSGAQPLVCFEIQRHYNLIARWHKKSAFLRHGGKWLA